MMIEQEQTIADETLKVAAKFIGYTDQDIEA